MNWTISYQENYQRKERPTTSPESLFLDKLILEYQVLKVKRAEYSNKEKEYLGKYTEEKQEGQRLATKINRMGEVIYRIIGRYPHECHVPLQLFFEFEYK